MQATSTRLDDYLAEIDKLAAERDRAVDAHVRVLLGEITTVRRALLDALAGLPSSKGKLSASALAPGRALADSAARDFSQRLSAVFVAGRAVMIERGTLFTPTALWAIGIGAKKPLKLTEAEGDAEPTFSFPMIVSQAQLDGANAITGEYIVGVSDAFRAQLRGMIVQNVTGQRSMSELYAGVRAALATQPDRQNGSLGTLTYQAERIVRTELLRSFSVGTEARSAELDAAVPGMRKSWRSARDGRVRPDHRSADTRYAVGGSPGPIAMNAYFHVGGSNMLAPRIGGGRQSIQCRCVKVEIHPSWFAPGRA